MDKPHPATPIQQTSSSALHPSSAHLCSPAGLICYNESGFSGGNDRPHEDVHGMPGADKAGALRELRGSSGAESRQPAPPAAGIGNVPNAPHQ